MHAPLHDLPIILSDVTVRSGGVDILRGISVDITRGGVTAVLGPNGAGKTTLIRIAMGLMPPTSGAVTWGGRADSDMRRRAIVFQRPVMMRRTVAQNVAFAVAELGGIDRPRRIAEALARTGLGTLANRPARRLSGGEQQRVAIARVLARAPEVLFLDEPTSSLDPASAKAIEAIVADAVQSGIKVVIATHDLGQARRLAADVIFLVAGRLTERTPATQFFNQPATPQAAAFLRGDIVE